MFILQLARRAAILGVATMLALPAFAQQFPSKPIRIIVAFGPGGTTDTVWRLYGQKMTELLGTPVIIDNKPGGNQMVAIRQILQAPPDGHTLYAAVGSSLVFNPALRKDLPYDPLKDFSLIGIAVISPGVIFVKPDLPIRSIGELVAYARANPGKLNYGSAGLGTAGHLSAEAILNTTQTKMTHIPYKADVDVIREVIAGNVQMGIFTTMNTVQYINAGQIRPLAVIAPHRLPYLPNVPSLAETDVKELAQLEPHTYMALVGPAGMSPAVVTRINDAVNKISAMPDVAARVRDGLYSEPATITPSDFRQFVAKEIAKWRILGKNVKLDD